MADKLKVMLEIGPKNKRVVAVAPEWPGLTRGAKTADDAIERLRAYLPRYSKVAQLAGMAKEFESSKSVEIVERYPGMSSTDFWGISFTFSSFDRQTMPSKALDRELTLMRACWAYFDEVRSRVSAEMQKGARGGGRDRDHIVRHTIGTEQTQFVKKLGLPAAIKLAQTDVQLRAHREIYCETIRAYHSQGKMARAWPLRYLIRHTAFHTLDHAWEMEDKDLTAKPA
jgi:hypothetical protein